MLQNVQSALCHSCGILRSTWALIMNEVISSVRSDGRARQEPVHWCLRNIPENTRGSSTSMTLSSDIGVVYQASGQMLVLDDVITQP